MSRFSEDHPSEAGVSNTLGITFPRTRLGQVLEVLFWLGFTAVAVVVIALVAWLLFGQR